MFAWHDPEVFDCSVCARKPSLKVKLGCEAPPTGGGGVHRFPGHIPKPEEPDVPDKAIEIDRCPLKFLTADVCDLFRALSLAGGAVPIADQAWLPEPYMQALFVAKTELEAARARRMKERGNG